AAAVLAALDGWPHAEVAIYNRTAHRATAVAARARVAVRVAATAEDAVDGATCVVNATTIGMTSDDHPVRLDAVPAGAAILDLVIRRGETSWVRDARARGHRASDGLPMLLEQGALAFERWFAIAAPREVMRDAMRVAVAL
ncbi:MAG: shikimate dehydrogenase, partial [Gemmatimonadaceae bacterium]